MHLRCVLVGVFVMMMNCMAMITNCVISQTRHLRL